MSIFAPMNVQAPIDRRKQLLEKLIQQYQTQSQTAAQTPMPGAVHAMGAPNGGQPWKGSTSMPIGPRTQITNPHALTDISPDVRAHLGPGGFHIPLPFEQSGSLGAPVTPFGTGMQNAPSQPNPNPQQGGPVQLPTLPGMPVAPAAPAAAPVAPTAPVGASAAPAAPAPGLASPNAVAPNPAHVALGNGAFFDPASGDILLPRGGTSPVAGGAANGLGSTGPATRNIFA